MPTKVMEPIRFVANAFENAASRDARLGRRSAAHGTRLVAQAADVIEPAGNAEVGQQCSPTAPLEGVVTVSYAAPGIPIRLHQAPSDIKATGALTHAT
jgi:hypothetical protein